MPDRSIDRLPSPLGHANRAQLLEPAGPVAERSDFDRAVHAEGPVNLTDGDHFG
jgi:hypothetical protein